MATNGYSARMKVRYREELLPRLQRELGLSNPMQVPRLEKIVVNMGIGDALKDAEVGALIEKAQALVENLGPQEAAKFLVEEERKWSEVARVAKIGS